MRVLIVDDNASMRAVLGSLLSGRGYTVVASLADGSQVMECIRQHGPDIVCLDYEMPGRNGLDILREINASMPQIDVVFITAAEDPAVRQQAADAGAAGFIQKPFGQRQIIEELEQVYAARQQASAANAKQENSAPPAAAAPAVNPGGADGVAAEKATPPKDRTSVIIADDNASIRLILKGLLSELGLNVVHLSTTGADAVSAAKTYQPAVVCLDVDMPVMSGLEALPLIREASPHTAVVMVTGNTSREFVEKAAAAGARGYIVKPIRPAYVEAFMRKLLK